MARFEQYEVWEFNQGRWQLVASFGEFEVAKELAQRRHYRVRLLRVTYDEGEKIRQEVLTEIGATRKEP